MNGLTEGLASWWENAERVPPRRGDLVIENHSGEGGPDYRVRPWPGGLQISIPYVRVLEAKPKPGPDVIVATLYATSNSRTERVALTWDDRGVWTGVDSDGTVRCIRSDELYDPVPMIERKATTEMIDRVIAARDYNGQPYTAGDYDAQNLLAAVLGLEKP